MLFRSGSLDVGGGVYEGINLNNAANGVKMYWDDTNKYFTTTSGGNSKAAVAAEGYADWRTGSDTNPTDNPVVSGRKWGRVLLKPML